MSLPRYWTLPSEDRQMRNDVLLAKIARGLDVDTAAARTGVPADTAHLVYERWLRSHPTGPRGERAKRREGA